MPVVFHRSIAFSPSPLRGFALPLTALLIAATPFFVHAAPKVATIKVSAGVKAVQSLPRITAQPQSVVTNVGQAATFSVTVSSVANPSYQWMRNGTKIVGAFASSYVMSSTATADSGTHFSVVVKNAAGSVTSDSAFLTVNAVSARVPTAARPFSDGSPWNARPSRFMLGADVVPTSLYYPSIAEGAYSLGVFTAASIDPSMTVYGAADGSGIWVPDAEASSPFVVIAHWPAGVVPAPGSDGHADIVDPANNRIHSFWQLRLDNGTWRAASYSWTALDGRGFGTPAQYMQGARAAGVPSMGGLIRIGEVNDGLPSYRHALAMSLTYNGLAKSPAYTFPATSADGDAATANSGTIPEGARLMIPASFDTSVIRDARLLKIVRTLQTYGAYVVDRNYGTPYVIYVENGSGFNLMPNGWDSEIAYELDAIRAALHPVASVSEWVDANGTVFTPQTNLNLLSMRGYWWMQTGTTAGVFDTQQQAVVFANNGAFTRQANAGNRSMPSVSTTAMAGKTVTMKVTATGGAQVRLDLSANGVTALSTGYLGDGGTLTFVWPSNGLVPTVWAQSGAAGGGTVSATLVAAP